MSEIEPADRDPAEERALEERDGYEPPRITSLGTVLELTGGGGGGGTDTDTISNASAAKGRGAALPDPA
jgi:hypothetical protein